MSLSKFVEKQTSFNPLVISATLFFVVLLVAMILIAPEQTQTLLNAAKSGIFANFSWFYVLAFSVFLGFLVILSVSSLGNIKLGNDEEEPEFGFLSWLAMLFAAGMGVGLMFFGVAEPLTHYLSDITTGTAEHKQQEALLHTLFHWGIHAWAVYGTIALALAYFGFRYKLPLALRSCFYPLLKERINGKLGDLIDIMALLATLFGIITTLGFGASQLGAGLHQLGWISENSFSLQMVVIVVVMSLAIFSAISGVGKGVKILSELNLTLAFCLLIFVLVAGPTLYLLSAFSDNIGTYLSNLVQLSFKTYVYEQEHTAWFSGWTILYWAWWCSWAPFVGLFIARISKGRTIREFIFGVLVVPSLFGVLWFTVFGNTAIWLNDGEAAGALGQMISSPETLLFKFLDYLPLSGVTGLVSLVVISLFFITSADSGIYVLNNIASRDKSLTAPRWQAVMWGVLMSVVSIVLMQSGGLANLQAMTLLVALPFAMLMLLMCFSLWKGLNADKWFARAVSDETFDLAKLAEHMSKHNSPYSGGVIKGVLSDMVDCIKELLLDGKCVKIDDLAIFGVGIRSKAADTLEEFSLEKNISGMRLKARATGNLSTNNLKLDSQLKQQAEYQKPTTAGGGSDSGDNPDPKPDGGGEAPDPAA